MPTARVHVQLGPARIMLSMSPDDPAIRRADARDVASITHLVNRAFEVEAFFAVGDRTSDDQIRAKLAVGAFVLAERRSELVGCVHVEHKDGPRAYISMLAVQPTEQGAGLGRRLMRLAEQHARQAHCTETIITVINLRTELPPFYRRLGYTEIGTKPYADAHRATQPVHFIVMAKSLTREDEQDRSVPAR